MSAEFEFGEETYDSNYYFEVKSRSLNWTDSLAVQQYYEELIRCELSRLNPSITDFNQHSFVIKNSKPFFTYWDYTECPVLTLLRIKHLEKNYFCFDLEEFVEITNATKNKKLSGQILIPEENSRYVTSTHNFAVPMFTYRTVQDLSVDLKINPYSITHQDGRYTLNYNITVSAACEIQILFKLKYRFFIPSRYYPIVYKTLNVTRDQTSAETVESNTGAEELVRQTAAQETQATRQETAQEVYEEPIVKSFRSDTVNASRILYPNFPSINKSLITLEAPSDFITTPSFVKSQNFNTPKQEMIFYALNENTYKTLQMQQNTINKQ